jgi:hypothetical protein
VDHSEGRGDSRDPLISPDGRYVIFKSQAAGLVAGDTNGVSDIFVRDLVAETTFCLSTNRFGPGDGVSGNASLGSDGRTVVFDSFATDLAADDYNACRDVFRVRLPFSDLDRDGLDDAWEIGAFGNLSQDGQGDSDRDGTSERNEYLAGTDPANPLSVLRLRPQGVWSEGRMTIFWNAVPGRTYRVQFAERLGGTPWQDLAGDVSTNDDLAFKVDAASERIQERYYRVIVIP